MLYIKKFFEPPAIFLLLESNHCKKSSHVQQEVDNLATNRRLLVKTSQKRNYLSNCYKNIN